jgi:hypothetical protein
MKIAIYGDSWGSLGLNEPRSYLGWPEILANQPGVEVTNFSVVASSLYYSYKEFIKNHKFYDINIFLITSIGRMYVNTMPEYFDLAKHVSGLANVLERKESIKKITHLSKSTKEQIEKINEALELYYVYLQDDEQDSDVDNALLHHAKSITTNTIFIPCFKQPDQPSLLDIYEMEDRITGASEKYFSKGIYMNSIVDGKCLRDVRICHLTKRNNEILAEKILKAINNKTMSIDLSITDFAEPTESIDEILAWRDF